MNGLHWLILMPILTAALAMLLPVKAARAISFFMQIALLVYEGSLFLAIRSHDTIIQWVGGWPQGIGIALRADLVAIDLVLVSTIIFLFLNLYGLKKSYVNGLFLFMTLSVQGLVNGIFLSNDLFTTFVLLEVSTVAISILIMLKRDSKSAYDGLIYLLTNAVAMSFYLFGAGMLYKTAGTIDISVLESVLSRSVSAKPFILPYAFMMTAASLKAALMPLFSWLPKAHATPSAHSEVSAILSGIYVKTGVYLLFRLQMLFSPVIDTTRLFLVLGLVTAIVGFLLAIVQKDMKLILAYHTVSQIGLILTGFCMGSPEARIGAVYHIINHALFKSTLFLTAGLVIERYQTRQIYQVRGVFREMPVVATAILMAILGITGAPFFNGSISKYWIAYGTEGTVLNYLLMLINLGTIVSFVKYAGILGGRSTAPTPHANKAPDRWSQGVVLVMGLICLLGGSLGSAIIRILFDVELVIEPASYLQKSVYYLATLVVGVALYRTVIKKSRLLTRFRLPELSFNGISLTIAGFFAFLFAYLNLTAVP